MIPADQEDHANGHSASAPGPGGGRVAFDLGRKGGVECSQVSRQVLEGVHLLVGSGVCPVHLALVREVG